MKDFLTDQEMSSLQGTMATSALPDFIPDESAHTYFNTQPTVSNSEKLSTENPIVKTFKGETAFNANTETSNPGGNIARTFGNIPSSAIKFAAPVNPLNVDSPVNIGSNIVKSFHAASDVLKNRGVVGGALDAAKGYVDTVGGGILKGYQKMGEKIYDQLLNRGFKGTLADVTESIAKIGIEDPLFIPSLFMGAGEAKGTDVIHDITAPITDGADTSISNIADKTTKAVQNNAVNNLEQDYQKWTGQTKSGVKRMGKIQNKYEALNQTGVTATPPERVLAENGIVPQTEGTKFRTFDQANDVRKAVQPLDDALDTALKEVKPAVKPTPLEEWKNQTVKNIEGLGKTIGDETEMVDDVNKEFELLKKRYPDGTIDIENLNKEKQAYGNTVKFDSTKPFKGDVNYQIRKSAQDIVEKTALDAGFKDVAQLNREIGDRLEGAKFLQNLDGQTIRGGRIGKYILIGSGASLGKTIVGKIFGALGGDIVGNILIKTSVANPLKRLILLSIKNKSPEAYQATLNWIKSQELARSSRLALPEPSFIPMEGPKPSESTVKVIKAKGGFGSGSPQESGKSARLNFQFKSGE